jgi:hypothetical protein
MGKSRMSVSAIRGGWAPTGLQRRFEAPGDPFDHTALTLKPDFGQVEADADTIELRDTERLLPEKRPFFREGDELIRMPHRLCYAGAASGVLTAGRVRVPRLDFWWKLGK